MEYFKTLPWELIEKIAEELDTIDIHSWGASCERIKNGMKQMGCRATSLDMSQTRGEPPDVEVIYEIAKICPKISKIAIDFKKVKGRQIRQKQNLEHRAVAAMIKRYNPKPGELYGYGRSKMQNYINVRQDAYMQAIDKCFGTQLQEIVVRNYIIEPYGRAGTKQMWKKAVRVEMTMNTTTWFDYFRCREFFGQLWAVKELKLENFIEGNGTTNPIAHLPNRSLRKIEHSAKVTPSWGIPLYMNKELEYLKCSMGKERGDFSEYGMIEAEITIPKYTGRPVSWVQGLDGLGAARLFSIPTMRKLTIHTEKPEVA